MGMQNNSYCNLLGTLVLIACSGCAGAGPLAWFSQKPLTPQEEAVNKLVSSKQSMLSAGKNSDRLPPAAVLPESVPKTEKDLKNPAQLHLYYARLQEQLGHLTEAKTFYEKVITKEPQSIEANIGLGRLEALAGHNAQAEQRFLKAIEIDPASSEAFFAYGKFLAGQKRYTEAIVEMQKAVRKKPDTKYKFEIGLTLARSGQYEQAALALSELVGQAEAYYNVGYIALKELHDVCVAEQYLRGALDVNPDLKQARYWLVEMKRNPGNILPASGTEQVGKQHVQYALNLQSASAHHVESHIPTTVVPETVNPDNLTPEQWEQWKNQSELQ